MIKKNLLSTAILWLFSAALFGQTFGYESLIEPVEQVGYYKVSLAPALLGKMKPDLSDLRIYDGNGKETPYTTIRENRVSTTSLFYEYEILESAYRRDTISYLIFGNPKRKRIDNVSFSVQNTDVQKRARLSGSNDGVQWFVIKNDYLLHSMKSAAETSELKMLNFPLSDYAFFKLEIDDNWNLPINILKVGYYDTQRKNGISTEIKDVLVTQKDSAKTSYLKLIFPEKMLLDELAFQLSGAEFYSRSTEVMMKVERTNRKNKKYFEYEPVAAFGLNSNSLNTFNFPAIAADELLIRIYNQDNPPLRVDGIAAKLLNTYIVVELTPENTYTLKFGGEKLQKPNYDLGQFYKQLTIMPTPLSHGPIVLGSSVTIDTESGIFDSGYVLWSILGGVGLLLAIVSFKMVRELGK